MNNNKKDIVLYGLIAGLVFAGAYIIGVQYVDEQNAELNESKQVAANWGMLNATELDCGEMRSNLISLERETFDGAEIISAAIFEKWQEAGC